MHEQQRLTMLNLWIRNRRNGGFPCRAFTLIELLTVIAIMASLIAIMLPTLHRVRRHAKAIACQSNLRQWGPLFAAYAEDNDSKLFDLFSEVFWVDTMRPYYNDEKLLCCPIATKPKRQNPIYHPDGDLVMSWAGGKFSAWEFLAFPDLPGWPKQCVHGSYGLNGWIMDCPEFSPFTGEPLRRWWKTCSVQGGSNMPVLLDSSYATVEPESQHPPSEHDDLFTLGQEMSSFCINRHDGFTNGLFMDWSIKKVGLKQLWTLKWHREFDTAGPWTKAGGVQPADWPKWMQRLRDY